MNKLILITFLIISGCSLNKLVVESYEYEQTDNEEELEVLNDFLFYNKKIKDYCLKNKIKYKPYKTVNNEFIGYRIITNNKIYFINGVTTGIDFILFLKSNNLVSNQSFVNLDNVQTDENGNQNFDKTVYRELVHNTSSDEDYANQMAESGMKKQNLFSKLFGGKKNREGNTSPKVTYANNEAKQRDQQHLKNNTAKANQVKEDDREYLLGKEQLKDGVKNSDYGPRVHPTTGNPDGFHHGTDYITKNEDKTIHALADGEVVDSRYQYNEEKGTGWGNALGVQTKKDGKDYFYRISHLKELPENIKVGDKIKEGQPIGTMGSTGGVTGPHLHTEVKVLNNGNWEDINIDPKNQSPINIGNYEKLEDTPYHKK